MTVTLKLLVPPKQLENSATTQYTAQGVKAIIDKATVTNTSASNVTLTAYLVNLGGSAGNSNMIIDAKTIVPDETNLCPELVGQVLEPGQTLVTLAGAATSLTMRVSGREIS